MRRRRAVSSTSSGRTPVGYRDLLAISKKPLPRGGEEVVWSCFWFRSPAPLLNAGRSHSAPLHQMMMVVMHVVNERECHKSCASLKTHSELVKFHTMRAAMTPDEQLEYLAKGSVDLIDRKDL